MILCAAIRISYNTYNANGVQLSDTHYLVIPCYRHSDGLSIVDRFIKYNPAFKIIKCEQGFISNLNTFMDRQAAYHNALDCGQLSSSLIHVKNEMNQMELFSEDLY